jgi:hypothetical protein
MKYLILLMLLVGCDDRMGYDSNKSEDYLTNGFLCDTISYHTSNINVHNCENVMTGKKVSEIINPSNVFIIKE